MRYIFLSAKTKIKVGTWETSSAYIFEGAPKWYRQKNLVTLYIHARDTSVKAFDTNSFVFYDYCMTSDSIGFNSWIPFFRRKPALKGSASFHISLIDRATPVLDETLPKGKKTQGKQIISESQGDRTKKK